MSASEIQASTVVEDSINDAAATLVQQLARSEILALRAYASARSLAPGEGILLNANENPWSPAADEGMHLNRYPDPQPQALVSAIADLYGVQAQQILLSRGSDEGIDLLVRAFCRAGTDRIAIAPPCFGMYEVAAQIQGAAIERYPLRAESGFLPDFAALAQTRAKLVFLCTPNNPSGNTLPRSKVLELLRALDGRALVVVDEAYIEFSDEASLCQVLAEYPNLVILRTLSKAWALAGARLGVLVAAPAIVALLRKLIAPYPLPKPSIVQCLKALGAESQLRMREQVALLRTERERIAQALGQHPQVRQVYPSAANFLLVRVADASQWMNAALAAGIVLRNQSSQPGLENCIRISIGTAAENDALLKFVQSLECPR